MYFLKNYITPKLGIRIRIRMFLGLADPDPDPLVRLWILPFSHKCVDQRKQCLQNNIFTKILDKI
jgi:hypothetical protein